jgi:hypothetical protein
MDVDFILVCCVFTMTFSMHGDNNTNIRSGLGPIATMVHEAGCSLS